MHACMDGRHENMTPTPPYDGGDITSTKGTMDTEGSRLLTYSSICLW